MSSTRDRLLGRWRLASYEARAENGAVVYPMGEGALGVLEYSADGKVSVHIMRAGADGYFAYYGDYAVDEAGGSVTHQLELASEPSFVGAENLRFISLEGEGPGARLTLSGPMRIAGRPHTIYVAWQRDVPAR